MPSSTTGTEGAKEEAHESMSCAESPQVSSNKEPESASCKEENMDICPLDSTTSPGTSEIKVIYFGIDVGYLLITNGLSVNVHPCTQICN